MAPLRATVFCIIAVVALAVPRRAQALPPPGLFLSDEWRYQPPENFGSWLKLLAARSFSDLVAMPSNAGTWSEADLATIFVTLGISLGGAVPVGTRSLDARIQDAIRSVRGPNCDYVPRETRYCHPSASSGFHLWGSVSNVIIVASWLSVPMGLLLWGVFNEVPQLVEAGTLAIEAFSVGQMFHVSLKLLVGREGPLWHDGAGTFHGPNASFFPDGWPSGHAATLFSIAAVYATYFEQTWLRVALLGAAGLFASMLVVDDAHYASDVVLGATLGYLVGRWVVHHRSSKFAYSDRGVPVRLRTIAPVQVVQGVGLGALFTF